MELTEHLFRHEWGRMVGAVKGIFGLYNLALAEDVVQEAFCRATEVWAFRGVPENPSALQRIRFTGRRSESSNFAAKDRNARSTISAPRSLWPAMTRSVISSTNAYMPVRKDDGSAYNGLSVECIQQADMFGPEVTAVRERHWFWCAVTISGGWTC